MGRLGLGRALRRRCAPLAPSVFRTRQKTTGSLLRAARY